MFILSLSKLILHPSSYNCLSDISKELVRSGSTTTVFPHFVRYAESDSSPYTIDRIDIEFGNVTLIELLGCMLIRHFASDYFI